MQPTGDIGVLLVHGIGDHKEGDTLTNFGEPLLDWLREWLLGKYGTYPDKLSALSVPEARLRAIRTEAESPAYAVATIGVPTPKPETERWILAEAWWGDSVQPPVALKLLKWLWSRGPLLIFWHFYLRADDSKKASQAEAMRTIVSLLLAASTQAAVVVALVLWIIPIGKWRAGVVKVVRAATLTLGDSYVLLENEIQRAALVDRVQRSLEWLMPRCTKVVIVAHSQGCAIAHEAIAQTADTTKIDALVTIGSGLEKLDFLRLVRRLRLGLVQAQLLVPMVFTGLGLVGFTFTSGGQRWHAGVGGAILFVSLFVAATLANALGRYYKLMVTDLARLRIVRPDGAHLAWTDISATHDVVPMGAGSLLKKQTFVKQVLGANEQSYLYDHVAYFESHNSFIPRAWQAMSGVSALALFSDQDNDRVERFARLHAWYARILAWSRRIAVLTAVVSLVAFRQELVTFGKSILDRVAGSPINDLMKPIRAVAGLVAWIAQLVWAPRTPVSDVATQAIVGGLILLVGVALWWAAFKSLWRVAAVVRVRALCAGADVLNNPSRTWRAVATCTGVQALGAVPALVVVILWWAPQILSLNAIGQALAAAIALVCIAGAVSIAVGGPWGWQEAVEAEISDADFLGAVIYPFGMAFLAGLLFLAGESLWPYQARRVLDGVQPIAWALHGLAWQIYGVHFLRQKTPRRAIAVMLVPFAVLAIVVAVSWYGPLVLHVGDYIVAYTLTSLIWVPTTLLSTVPEVLRKIVPAVGRLAREQVKRIGG